MNKATLKSTRITDAGIKINIKTNESFELEVKTETQIAPPVNKDVKTALFKIVARITMPDSDDIDIRVAAEMIFEFDEIPTNYNEAGQKLCLAKAQKNIFDKIGDMMEIMGYNRFDIQIPEE